MGCHGRDRRAVSLSQSRSVIVALNGLVAIALPTPSPTAPRRAGPVGTTMTNQKHCESSMDFLQRLPVRAQHRRLESHESSWHSGEYLGLRTLDSDS